MTQDMLAVLRAHPDHVFLVAGDEGLAGEIPDVREEISPLCCQEVHEVESLGAGFQQCCSWRQEVDVSVCVHPSFRAEVSDTFDLQLELALPGSNLQLLTHRRVFKSLRHLQVHVAYR